MWILLLLAAAQQPPGGFDEYARQVETRIAEDGPNFLRLAQDDGARARLRAGEVLTSPAAPRGLKPQVSIAGAQIQHWVGAMFLPCRTLAEAIPRLQGYDRRKLFMSPEITESSILGRDGNDFKVYLRLHEKSVVSGTFDVYLSIAYRMLDDSRLLIASRSDSIAEVATPDRGLLRVLNHYWRVQEADGGLYVECEALVLSRKPPGLIQWIADPMIAQASRKTLLNTLEATRRMIESDL
jgi:hypothetical protein